jgi:DNA repair protein REV1
MKMETDDQVIQDLDFENLEFSDYEESLGQIQEEAGAPTNEGLSNAMNKPLNSDSNVRHVDSESPNKRAKMTAEEHNAILLSDPNIRKTSSANPNFLKQFYSESRLHHLSTWKADLKSQLQAMTGELSPSQKALRRRPTGSRRYILHIDFDCFFVAVSLKSAPEYIDKPAVVAHGSGAGSEIACCNYPARTFGVKNGMWMRKALELCADLKVLPYDFKGYEAASRQFYEAILSIGGIVQSVSIDEALIDITNLVISTESSNGTGTHQDHIPREQAKASEIALNLRNRVKERTGCNVSVGIGGNVLLAKVALRNAKPAGQCLIKPEEVLDFIGELTMRDLPGVAYSIGGKLEDIGVKFVKDVRNLSKERLIVTLGPKTGEKIWDYSRGVDKTEVGEQIVRKSVSAEVSWGIRFINQAEAEEFVHNLCMELHRRLMENKVRGRQLTMKIMRRAADAPLDPPKHLGHGKCDVFNKSVMLGVATHAPDIIGKEAVSILRSFGFSPGELRGLGVQMTKLEPLKGTVDGRPEGSQKMLQFKSTTPTKRAKHNDDPITDDFESPPKLKSTPLHPAAQTTMAKAPENRSPKPLNTMGTQFILPSQVDPDVLAELPEDIRSKIVPRKKQLTQSHEQAPSKLRPESLTIYNMFPSHSQLDPEALDALPPDIREEVLASYAEQAPKLQAQSALPHPSRKTRAIVPKKQMTPTKKRPSLLSRSKNANKSDSNSAFTQSSFVSRSSRITPKSIPNDEDTNTDDISPDFLAALPEDIRREVIQQHRLDRLKQTSNLSVPLRRPKSKSAASAAPPVQRRLRLAARPEKPTFTTQKLSTLPELRDVIDEWWEAFAAEGPNEEDVEALARYLWRVIIDERNLEKAVKVVQWVRWRVGNGPEDGKETIEWQVAVQKLGEKVQAAVKERGLGTVEL